MDDFSLIGQLRDAFSGQTSEQDLERGTKLAETLEARVENDPRKAATDRELLAQLHKGIAVARETLSAGRTPDLSLARTALLGLERSIQKRTMGEDGWPLKG